jgi:hypothetical protein
VDCWIGVVQEGDRRIIRLAGRLSVAEVPELLEVCMEGGPVELVLTELVSADMAGIEALLRVRMRGAMLVDVPAYMQLRLESAAAHIGTPPPRGGRGS